MYIFAMKDKRDVVWTKSETGGMSWGKREEWSFWVRLFSQQSTADWLKNQPSLTVHCWGIWHKDFQILDVSKM